MLVGGEGRLWSKRHFLYGSGVWFSLGGVRTQVLVQTWPLLSSCMSWHSEDAACYRWLSCQSKGMEADSPKSLATGIVL